MNLRNRSRREAKDGGFTLVEIMIAVTLTALIALAVWGVLRISIASWTRGTAEMDANQRHRATMDLVEKQLASIYPLVPPVDLQSGAVLTPVFAGTESAMQFVTLSALRSRDNPGMAVVTYEAVRKDAGDYALVEREVRYLGGDPALEEGPPAEEVPAATLFDGLESVTFEYCDPGTAELPMQWVRDWSAKDKGSLPAAISVTMVYPDARGGRQLRQVVVPITAQPAAVQQNFVDPFLEQRRRLGGDATRR